jgi:protease-4
MSSDFQTPSDSTRPPIDAQPPSSAPVAPSSARKSRAWLLFWGIIGGCLVGLIGLTVLMAVLGAATGSTRGADWTLVGGSRIAIVPIEGEILDARDTIDAIHRYERNPAVKAIVIRINSPGGAIAPSQEIYEEIRNVRQRSGKRFVASMDSVAASGGYYIAAACDQIVANPGTITGSIGVIMQWMDIEDLVRWAKLRPETITAGAMKDAGSPYRALSPSERAYFQTIAEQLHGQFIRAVTTGRSGRISEAEVTRIADGRVFTGEEAKRLKLVDSLGNLEDAIKIASGLAGLHHIPSTIYPRRRGAGLLDLLTHSEDTQSALQRIFDRGAARFMYRW